MRRRLPFRGYGVVVRRQGFAGKPLLRQDGFLVERDQPDAPAAIPALDVRRRTRRAFVMGQVTDRKRDAMGLWFEAQLETGGELCGDDQRPYQRGRPRLFHGVRPAHLVEYVGNAIKTWPIFELSLTPTPVEPRTIGVELQVVVALSNALYCHYPNTHHRGFLPSPRLTPPVPRETTKRRSSRRQSPKSNHS